MTLSAEGCDFPCALQILRDIITPDIEQLKPLENFGRFARNYFLKTGSFPALHRAIARADEIHEKCANIAGVESKCSFKAISKPSPQKLALIAFKFMITVETANANKYLYLRN